MSYIRRNVGPNARPLLKSDILDAQSKSKSASAAARYLNTDYKTYKKYATMYGIFENLKNPRGFGIRKGRSLIRIFPVEDILAGKHPKYSINHLKRRLLRGKYLDEECMRCHFNERRFTDKKVPLILNVRDGNTENKKLTNLELLCYNCTFLMYGQKHDKRAYKLEDESEASPSLVTQIEELSNKSIVRNNTLTSDDKSLIIPDGSLLGEIGLEGVELSNEELERIREELKSEA